MEETLKAWGHVNPFLTVSLKRINSKHFQFLLLPFEKYLFKNHFFILFMFYSVYVLNTDVKKKT